MSNGKWLMTCGKVVENHNLVFEILKKKYRKKDVAYDLESSSATSYRATNLEKGIVSEIVLLLALSVFFLLGWNMAQRLVCTHLPSGSLTHTAFLGLAICPSFSFDLSHKAKDFQPLSQLAYFPFWIKEFTKGNESSYRVTLIENSN